MSFFNFSFSESLLLIFLKHKWIKKSQTLESRKYEIKIVREEQKREVLKSKDYANEQMKSQQRNNTNTKQKDFGI